MTCAVCKGPPATKRSKRGETLPNDWIAPDGTRTCSTWCFDALLRKQIMIDPTDHEQAAMDHAGEQAGEYLETLGKTDLAQMSPEEWATLINVICSGYVEKLQGFVIQMENDAAYLRSRIETPAA